MGIEVCACRNDSDFSSVDREHAEYYTLSANQVEYYERGYFVAGLISLISCICICISFIVFKKHRQHPSELLLGRAVCDIGMAISQMSLYATGAAEDCGRSACAGIGASNQFFGVTADMWIVCIGVDLILTIRNPFSGHSQYRAHYHALTWLVGALFTVIPVREYGVSLFNMCWLNEQPCHGFSPFAVATHFSLMLLFLLFLIGVFLFARRVFAHGMPKTFETRKRVLEQSQMYIAVFGIYWLSLCVTWLVHAVYVYHTGSKSPALIIIFIILQALRGPVDALAWTLSISMTLRRMWKKGGGSARYRSTASGLDELLLLESEAGADINQALRRDIMLCTAWGILFSLDSEAPTSAPRPYKLSTPNAFSGKSFDVVEYDPLGFATLREVFGVTNAAYRSSFDNEGPEDTFSEKLTEGRSNSFFYFTWDQQYIVKTISKAEREILLAILPAYTEHVRSNEASILTRFMGLYSIRMSPEQNYVNFVVMRSVFAGVDTKVIHIDERYDIKGSWINRRSITTAEDDATFRGTRKDMDVRGRFQVGAKPRSALLAQITSDLAFLNDMQIMDYSVLVGVHRCHVDDSGGAVDARNIQEPGAAPHCPTSSCCHLACSREEALPLPPHAHPKHYIKMGLSPQGIRGPGPYGPGTSLYFFGIIDMLQLYNVSKRLEHFFKSRVLCKDPHGISAVEPDEYAERLIQRMRDLTDSIPE